MDLGLFGIVGITGVTRVVVFAVAVFSIFSVFSFVDSVITRGVTGRLGMTMGAISFPVKV